MRWPADLHATLDRRAMPETVATLILSDPASSAWFAPAELALLGQAAGARGRLGYVTSMPEDFARPADCARQVAVALAVFGQPGPWLGDPADLGQVAGLVDALGARIGWRHGMDWKADRLTRAQRVVLAANAEVPPGPHPRIANGHRSYNKGVRVLRNLWDHAVKMGELEQFRRFVLIGHSGFACDIPFGRFLADPDAAAFAAWMTAKRNVRREFTWRGRENPFDRVAAALLARCEARGEETDWPMIASVWARPEVLRHLGDDDLGQLLGRWWTVMRDTSVMLAAQWKDLNEAQAAWAAPRQKARPGMPEPERFYPSQVDRSQMTVTAGMNSDRWNGLASAYNEARAGWLGCIMASGNGPLLVPYLPGKVMRLMAYDLWRWQQARGEGVHPATQVWARLPAPWDVIAGLEDCTLADVEAACAQVTDRATGRPVDPVASGWSAPLARQSVAEWRPTPDLVHGVAVASPEWALVLKRAGVFSGKTAKPGAALLRARAEAEGMVTGELPVYDEAGAYQGTTKEAGG